MNYRATLIDIGHHTRHIVSDPASAQQMLGVLKLLAYCSMMLDFLGKLSAFWSASQYLLCIPKSYRPIC